MALEPAPDAVPHRQAAPRREPGSNRLWKRLLAPLAFGASRRAKDPPSGAVAAPITAVAGPPREVAAAGVIGLAALLLALAAGDGEVEFPGPGFEARLMSRPPASPPAEAAEDAAAAALATPLAERLVEDPAFEGAPAGAPAGWSAEKVFSPTSAGTGADAAAVLSAASPAPADPALRLQERQRGRGGAGPAESKPHPAYSVQLVAVSRREQATQAWGRLYRDHADLLGRLQPIIVEPEQRVTSLFRLRAGPMASAGEAQSVCASLARRGVDCIVVHRGG